MVSSALLDRSATSSIIYLFPTATHNGTPLPWAVHRLYLDRLPALPSSKTKNLEWVNTHVSLAFSDRERSARENKKMEPITHIKDSMHSIFVQAVGLQGPMKASVFGLHRTSGGGIDTLIFITDMKFDLAGHTVVTDAFVLPLHDTLLDRVSKGLQNLAGKMVQVNINDEECIAWKVLLPSLVERCRTWEHTSKCEYVTRGVIPLSTQHGEVPICECGKGKVTDVFRRRKEWSPFLPYVTRVAISPLFAVSYQESVAGGLRDTFGSEKSKKPALNSGSASGSGIKEVEIDNSVRCGSCDKTLSQSEAKVCGKCKIVAYCSRDCQLEDWKVHKSSCKKA